MQCIQGLADRGCRDRKILHRLSHWFQGSDGSVTSHVSFRKRKGDEVDGMDEVAKKKSKKEKDKDSRLEKALKVSSELCLCSLFRLFSVLILGRNFQGVCASHLAKTSKNSQTESS